MPPSHKTITTAALRTNTSLRELLHYQVGISAARMTGAEFENQTLLQPLPLGGRAAEQNLTCYIFREKKNINDVDD